MHSANKIKINHISYEDFINRVTKECVKKNLLTDGSIELTFRCNLKCSHCYVSYHENINKKKEMSYEEICNYLDQLAKEGLRTIVFNGGEPLIRKDFLEIYTYAKKKGFMITVFTNANLVNKKIINCFKKYRPLLIEVSLYGITPQTYESITGVNGSFKKAIKGINLLLKNKISVTLKTIAIQQNKKEIIKMKKWAEKNDMGFKIGASITPRINGSRKPCKFRLSPKETAYFESLNKGAIKKWLDLLNKGLKEKPKDCLYLCKNRCNSFFINPYGKMMICEASRNPSYNLRKGTIKEGIKFLKKIRKEKIRKNTKCVNCKLRYLCQQCPGWAQIENNDPEKPIEYFCQITKAKKNIINRIETSKD